MKLEGGVKLRVANPSEILELLNYLFALLNMKAPVGATEHDNHMQQIVVLGDLLRTGFKNDTIEEIKEAFVMSVSGKFKIELYQKLDSIILGKVMREYRVYKSQKLEQYKREKITEQKEMEVSEEEKQRRRNEFLEVCLYRPYEDLKKGVWSFNDFNLVAIHDIFFDKGLIQITKEMRQDIKKEAILMYKQRLNSPRNQDERFKFKNMLKRFEETNDGWQSLASQILITKLLKDFAEMEEDIKELLK